MKKKFIILLCMFAVVSAFIVLIYLDYENQKSNNADIDYKEDYKDEINVMVEIEPILLNNGKLFFNQRKSDEMIEKKVSEISELLNSIPTTEDKLNDMEKVIDTDLTSLFEGYEDCLVGSATTNNTHKGYAIQTQKKSGLAQFVNIVASTDDSLESKQKSVFGENILDSTIEGIPCQIFYNHIIREEEISGQKTEQFIYEIVLRHNDINFYLKIYFCGFDIHLKMVKTTKEDTSRQVSDFLQKFASAINTNPN